MKLNPIKNEIRDLVHQTVIRGLMHDASKAEAGSRVAPGDDRPRARVTPSRAPAGRPVEENGTT